MRYSEPCSLVPGVRVVSRCHDGRTDRHYRTREIFAVKIFSQMPLTGKYITQIFFYNENFHESFFLKRIIMGANYGNEHVYILYMYALYYRIYKSHVREFEVRNSCHGFAMIPTSKRWTTGPERLSVYGDTIAGYRASEFTSPGGDAADEEARALQAVYPKGAGRNRQIRLPPWRISSSPFFSRKLGVRLRESTARSIKFELFALK